MDEALMSKFEELKIAVHRLDRILADDPHPMTVFLRLTNIFNIVEYLCIMQSKDMPQKGPFEKEIEY